MRYPKFLAYRVPFAAFAALLLATSLTPGCGSTAESLASEDKGEIVVRRSESGDPRYLDPHLAGDVVSSRHCGMTYECLFQYDYLIRPPVLIPALAAEMPAYDEESLTYTFKIRDDVFFQDDRCFHPEAAGLTYRSPGEGEGAAKDKGKGRKLTARDFEYSLKRLAALDSGGFWVIEGKIKGLDSFRGEALSRSGEGPADDPEKTWREYLNETPVSGIKVLDEHTFSVTLTEPYPQFLYAMTLSYGAAVAHEAADYYRRDFFQKPVGTGPFILSSWRQNWELVWVRNPNFRDERFPTSDRPEDQKYAHLFGKKLPIADRVDFRIIKESQPAFLNFRKGHLDVSGISTDQFDAVITAQAELTPDMQEQGIQLMRYAEPTIHYLSFNMNDPVVGVPAGEKGRAIRKAVSLCIDREDYIRRYLNGRGQPAQQLVPPAVMGRQDENKMPSQVYDAVAGRKVLTDAGFLLEGSGDNWIAKDPTTMAQVQFTLLFRSTSPETQNVAKFMKASARRVGILLETELLTFPEFLRRQDEGKGQAYDAGWVMDYPDAQNMLQLLYGPNKPPGINSAAYDNPNYNTLYEEMAPLSDAVPPELDRKMSLIKQMHDQLEQDTPWVLMEFRVIYALNHEWHLPPKPNAFAYTYIKFAYSDSEKRAEKATEWETSHPIPALLMVLLLMVPATLMGVKVLKER